MISTPVSISASIHLTFCAVGTSLLLHLQSVPHSDFVDDYFASFTHTSSCSCYQ